MNAPGIRTRRWTRAEYYRCGELGIFHPTERLELIGGQIIVKERQSPGHATAIRLAGDVFEAAIAAHLSCPPLVLEVAEATVVLDRDYKTSLYARAQIPDYWLVNLIDGTLEVYRDPERDAERPFGYRYAPRLILRLGDFVTPLAAPSSRIAVADLLP